MILVRRVATAVGCGLMLLGIAIVSPLLMLTIYGVIGLIFGIVFLDARRRSRSRPRPTKTEQVEAVKRFVQKQRRVDMFQAIFLAYLIAVLYWLQGLSTSTLLFAFGGALVSAERLLVEPRIWAAISREDGLSLS